MALLPGQEKAGGEGTAPSALRLGLGWEGGNDQGSLLGWGWLRGQQSRRVRGQIDLTLCSQPVLPGQGTGVTSAAPEAVLCQSFQSWDILS